MLAEDRHARIIKIVEANGSATVVELASTLNTSESTIRRDLEKLSSAHRLRKVRGGATAISQRSITSDVSLSERHSHKVDEKSLIAQYAASLIAPDDFVYLDSGSTVEQLVDVVPDVHATYVTNSVRHALKLVTSGRKVVLLGGELKGVTEALVGQEAIDTLARMNFTIGFWGTNGISAQQGLTTPDRAEAAVKRLSMRHTMKRMVLADSSKFDCVAPISFASIDEATILTNDIPDAYLRYNNIVDVLSDS